MGECGEGGEAEKWEGGNKESVGGEQGGGEEERGK